MDHLVLGRDAFAVDAWVDAADHLEAADREASLGLEDLRRAAVSSYLLGREEAAVDWWARGYRVARDAGDDAGAADCAFWVAFTQLNRGDLPAGDGWVVRAERHVDVDPVGAARCRVDYLRGLQVIFAGDAGTAITHFEAAVARGDERGDRDVATLARLGLGRALLRRGRYHDGIRWIDEAMVAVTSGELSPIAVGDAYCTAIDGCSEVLDLPRVRQWTEGLGAWCAANEDLVAFRGQCQLHRAQVLQSTGDWPTALQEARQATRRLTRPVGQLALGAACYQEGELHRLRGAFEDAEDAYERARDRGREPLPGLALLWVARGRPDAAAAAIRRRLAETRSPSSRSHLLPGAVEVLVAAGDTEAARQACAELERLAGSLNSRVLDASAGQARGAVAIAGGDPDGALAPLRRSQEEWHRLDVPYEAARTRVLIGRACRQLDDEETAASEWAAARRTFARLGATPALRHLDHLTERPSPQDHGLTAREWEVLRGLAAGDTNRRIAEDLVISPRTVDRHVSNILAKFGVSSRTAATAHAYEHGLLGDAPPG